MIIRCSNKYCYISGVLLTEENISDEHIIPNALGGHLKCPDLVCADINNNLFGKLDAELAKSLELAQLMNFKRERGEQPSIIGENFEGLRYSINNNRIGTLMPLKPFLFIDENGKSFMKFPASQKEEYIKSQLKKNPQLSRSDLENKYSITVEYKKEIIHYKHGGAIFSNKEPFRGIAKLQQTFVW